MAAPHLLPSLLSLVLLLFAGTSAQASQLRRVAVSESGDAADASAGAADGGPLLLPPSPLPAFSAAPSFGPAPATPSPAPPGPAPPAPPQSAARRCAPDDQPSDVVERFQRTWLCVELTAAAALSPATLTSAVNTSAAPPAAMRAAFDPPCDRFSLIQIAGSYKLLATRVGATLIAAASLGASTAIPKLYLSADGSFVFPSYTVVVAVVGGNVQAVAFDEGCAGCGERSGACGANTVVPAEGRLSCFVPRASCIDTPQPSNPAANSCDLKIFVVWAGEDAHGDFFTSSASRLSRFSAYPLQAAQLLQEVMRFASVAAQGALPRK